MSMKALRGLISRDNWKWAMSLALIVGGLVLLFARSSHAITAPSLCDGVPYDFNSQVCCGGEIFPADLVCCPEETPIFQGE
jgi:hypothetical protein